MIMHPERYPVHGKERGTDPEKGQVYGGLCNTTRCENDEAVYWNCCTRGLYCRTCARGINWKPNRPPLCVDLGQKPASIEEMNELTDGFSAEMRRLGLFS